MLPIDMLHHSGTARQYQRALTLVWVSCSPERQRAPLTCSRSPPSSSAFPCEVSVNAQGNYVTLDKVASGGCEKKDTRYFVYPIVVQSLWESDQSPGKDRLVVALESNNNVRVVAVAREQDKPQGSPLTYVPGNVYPCSRSSTSTGHS